MVDTAAEVTIISDSLYRRLCPKPHLVQNVTLHTASKNLDMVGYVVVPVSLQLGSRVYSIHVYVAPIEDDMLLGLDLIGTNGVTLNLKDSMLTIGLEQISMSKGGANGKCPTIAKVCISKRAVVPPNYAKMMQCTVSETLAEFRVEPIFKWKVYDVSFSA